MRQDCRAFAVLSSFPFSLPAGNGELVNNVNGVIALDRPCLGYN